MKHIAFVTPDMEVGGVQQSLLTMLRAFPLDKVNVTLVLFSAAGDLISQIPPGIEVLEVKDAGKLEIIRKRVSAVLQRLGVNRLFTLAKHAYHSIGGKIKVNKCLTSNYDLVIAYNDGYATWYTARQIQAPHKIAFVHTDFQAADYVAENERTIYRQFDSICFNSVASRNSFLTLLPEFMSKTVIVPNVVDKERIRELAAKGERLPNKKDIIRLLTVGRVSREKGFAKVPELIKLLKEAGCAVCWYIVGDGPERGNLQTLAVKNGVSDELVLLGQTINPYAYMASCDVYVQPSDYEGYCIALAEARALNKPILACDFNGAREQIIDGLTGFITGKSSSDIYPKLKSLVLDGELRESFSLALREDEGNKSDALKQWIESIVF